MTPQYATTFIPAPPQRVYQVLLEPLALPDWNPAFTGASGPVHATTGTDYPITVRPGLTGHWRYTAITPDRVDTAWQVPGLRETGSWTLRLQTGGTLISHTFEHTGPLAVALRHAFQGVADLRLQRLAERCDAAATNGVK